MSTQPTPTSRYELARIKDTAIRTIRALDEQNTVEYLLVHINNGLLTEVEAWRLISNRQFIKQDD